jgi:hypothetical protein
MDSNFIAGIYLVLLPIIAKAIETKTTKKDKRFKLGYNPASMSFKGWVLTIIWLVIWVAGLFQVVKII